MSREWNTNIYAQLKPVLACYVDKEELIRFDPDATGFNTDFDHTRAGIYAYSDEFMKDELIKFRNFPGSHLTLGWITRSYRMAVPLYSSMVAEKPKNVYMYKQDAYALLLQQLELSPLGDVAKDRQRLCASIDQICYIFLRTKEMSLLGDVCEFVSIDVQQFNALEKELQDILTPPLKPDKKLRFTDVKKAIKKELTAAGIDTSPESEFEKSLSSIEKKLPFSSYRLDYQYMVHYSTHFLKKANAFINKWPAWFTKAEDYVPLLREFTNGEKRFFLATEVLAAIQSQKLNGGAFEEELVKLVEDRLATISREDCEKKWAEHVQGATFDEQEIVLEEFRRTRRRAVFTLYDKNKYCVLAADAFVELLRYVISVKGIFRTADPFQWSTFRDKFFAEVYKIEPKFGVIDASAPLLIDVERVNYIHDEVNIWIEVEYACELDTVREVGSIEGQDLELYELQTKMQTLGLANLFVECRRYLAFLFASFQKGKFILTTFDLYEIIEQCQLLAILVRLPERYKWLESQGHENQYPFNCVSYYDIMQQIEHNVPYVV
ncbi:hypothetical protein CAEBREN_00288 [Caenorhabditis brenneri]|uniref:DUF7809 domain-containing protein n=1 Tax=Caenorhabditis brenneri TaxID=135651 RepID=G0NHW3_CAEBE|nr:hypothetical protein CAEBREN_00288 [Caenorhabditis brenneri]